MEKELIMFAIRQLEGLLQISSVEDVSVNLTQISDGLTSFDVSVEIRENKLKGRSKNLIEQ